MQLTLPQSSQPLKVWEKIEIIVGTGNEKGIYVSRIEDFVGGGIIITSPEFQEGNTLLRDNCEVMVLITKDDAVYSFASRIRKFKAPRKNLFILTPPLNIKRVQRRQFVRIDYFEKIKIAAIGEQHNLKMEYEWSDAFCHNISGGGLLIKVPFETKTNCLYLIKIGVFDKLEIEQPVAAICRRTFNKENDHFCGVEFIKVNYITKYFSVDQIKHYSPSIAKFDLGIQNRLVNYVFKQQIEMRKKGLI